VESPGSENRYQSKACPAILCLLICILEELLYIAFGSLQTLQRKHTQKLSLLTSYSEQIVMAKFESRDGDLYIDSQKVIKGYESVTGWYWFATEDAGKQDSYMGGDQIINDDQIYFGLVQGQYEEWGYFSEGELKQLVKKGWVWEIKRQDLPYSGRREYRMGRLFDSEDTDE
jgi:hypothetical protein